MTKEIKKNIFKTVFDKGTTHFLSEAESKEGAFSIYMEDSQDILNWLGSTEKGIFPLVKWELFEV